MDAGKIGNNITSGIDNGNVLENVLPNNGESVNPASIPQESSYIEDNNSEDLEFLNEEESNEAVISDQVEEENLPQVGDKVDSGKVIGENGQVEDSATKKLTKAVGRGAAAYFSGGQSLKYDKMVTENAVGDKLLGVVSDGLEKNEVVKQAAEGLDEMGVTDAVNSAMNTAGSALEGNIGETVENAAKTAKDLKKSQDKMKKKMIMTLLPALAPLGLLLLIVLVICAPVLGGSLDVTEGDNEEIVDPTGGEGGFVDDDDISKILGEIESTYGELSPDREAIITTALSVIGLSYEWGGHPSGPGINGIPTKGLDCAGFVQWVYWTALGESPGYLTTQTISDLIGGKFVTVSYDELLPGDIALKYQGYDANKQNHTGIFAGNGKWIHAKGEDYGVVYGNYSKFTVYLRYVGVE